MVSTVTVALGKGIISGYNYTILFYIQPLHPGWWRCKYLLYPPRLLAILTIKTHVWNFHLMMLMKARPEVYDNPAYLVKEGCIEVGAIAATVVASE